MQHTSELQRRMADALRIIAIERSTARTPATPGAPIGMADIAQVLRDSHLKHNPANLHGGVHSDSVDNLGVGKRTAR